MKLAMLTSVGLSVVAAAALASQSATTPASEKSESPKSCCAKASDGTMKCDKPAKAGETATDEKPTRMRCSLTGEVVDKCCCVEREGKTHCTLADKDVAECCCTPVKDDQSASAKAN